MTDRLDEAIDHALREMLDVEPRPSLQARVMARIEERQASAFSTRVASAFRRKTVWAAVAAAAVILIALVVARRNVPAPALAPTAAPSMAQANPQPVAPVVPAATSPGDGRTTRLSLPHAVPPRTAQRAVAANVPDAANTGADDIEPLRTIAPISVAAIAPRGIAPSPIRVAPLGVINDLQISPLTPPEGRH
jgi:hypothetical protein